MKNPVTIVIPNFNGAKLLEQHLPSAIAALRAYQNEIKLVVVDDGSEDESVKFLQETYPEIKLVIHDKNKGFSEAVLSGVKAAETELLFILNSDVTVEANVFEYLVPYFENKDTFSVNPLIYGEKSKIKKHSWNLRQFRQGHFRIVPWKLEDALQKANEGKKLPTLYAHGGSFMVSREKFLELDGFHPIYKPFYREDYDLGVRAWLKGWPSYFEPRVFITHYSMGSIKSNLRLNYIKSIRRRNRYIFDWVFLSPSALLLKSLPFCFLQLLGEFILLDKKNIKGFFLALKKLPEIREYKKQLAAEKPVYSLTEILEKLKM